MDFPDKDISGLSGQKELIDITRPATGEDIRLPSTKRQYDKVYRFFKKWLTSKKSLTVSQALLMEFFKELAERYKPTTLWTYYSMLKGTMRAKDKIDIGSYSQLLDYLRSTANNYSPAQVNVFSSEDIQNFIDTAPDELWLDVKVVCIFAVLGRCSSQELTQIKLKDTDDRGNVLLVRIPVTTITKVERLFEVFGQFLPIVRKYIALRHPHLTEERFFINYQRGRCTNQPIGKNKFAQMARRIAKYLKLPEPHNFTGNSFRRTTYTFKLPDTTRTNGPGDSMQHSKPSGSSANANCANQSNKKFGEIYCSPMGVLSYHCTLCPTQMDHSDEFSLHYMTHFREVFQMQQESQKDPKILESQYGFAEPIEPIFAIKLENTQIKSEPTYPDDDESNTYDSFILS